MTFTLIVTLVATRLQSLMLKPWAITRMSVTIPLEVYAGLLNNLDQFLPLLPLYCTPGSFIPPSTLPPRMTDLTAPPRTHTHGSCQTDNFPDEELFVPGEFKK